MKRFGSILVVVYMFLGSCIAQIVSQYPETAPILTEVMKELSEAKAFMQSTNDRLMRAEYSISRLYKDEALRSQKSAQNAHKGFQGHKLVHLDLSGAPPKMNYLLELIPFVRVWGATGFLVEYVDTFPFQDDLQLIRGQNVYSKDEIQQFLMECNKVGMLVIPLVQTFGHLEYVLKHEQFADLRETERYTNSLCTKNPNSLVLVKKMIDQVARLHPTSPWIHVGGDEVWNLKTCPTCKKSNDSKADIFLGHMIPVLQYVRQQVNKTPVMWDDMMRDWELDKLEKMSQLVEPMLWGYRTPLEQHFPKGTWEKYNTAFPRVWMASAFKGAYKSNANFVRINIRLQNNLDWIQAASNLPNVTIMGLALTGWSRYDYFGSLCELLPASIPSLAVCLTAVKEGYMDGSLLADVSKLLGFRRAINIDADFAEPSNCEAKFPGHEIYKLVCDLSLALHKLDLATDTKNTWTLPRQMKTKDISYFRLMFGKSISQGAITLLKRVKSEARGPLSLLFSNNTIEEWIKDKIDENLLASTDVKMNFVRALNWYEHQFRQQKFHEQQQEQEQIEETNKIDEKNVKEMKQQQLLQRSDKQSEVKELKKIEDNDQYEMEGQQAQEPPKQAEELQSRQQQPSQQQEEDENETKPAVQLQNEQTKMHHDQQQAIITPHESDEQQEVEELHEVRQGKKSGTTEDQQQQETKDGKLESNNHEDRQQKLQNQYERRKQNHNDQQRVYLEEAIENRKKEKQQEEEHKIKIQQNYMRKYQKLEQKEQQQEKKLKLLQDAVENRIKDLKSSNGERKQIEERLAEEERFKEKEIDGTESFHQQQKILKRVGNDLKTSRNSQRDIFDDFGEIKKNNPTDTWEYAYGSIKPLTMNKQNTKLPDYGNYDRKPKARLGTFHLDTRLNELDYE